MPDRIDGAGVSRPICLVLLPHSYTGRGPAESCVRILDALPECGFDTSLYVLRARKPVHPAIKVVEGAGPFLRRLPFRYMQRPATRKLHRKFARAIDQAPRGSIAWFWPDSPTDLVRRAKARGLVTVREMINSPIAHAKPILDAAYAGRNLPVGHGISDAAVRRENEELLLYDYLFASNDEVEAALLAQGIDRTRILSTSFGWDRSRFTGGDEMTSHDDRKVRMCFVGLMNVRKGVPELLDAWREAKLDAELLLAGTVEECLMPMVEKAKADGLLQHLGQVSDVASLYRKCDVFVFPTLEEGGPQVTYEAAACGLPVVTTPMGAARLVRNHETGMIVEAGNVPALIDALRVMATDRDLCRRSGAAAKKAAQQFEYSVVGRQRAELLRKILLQSS